MNEVVRPVAFLGGCLLPRCEGADSLLVEHGRVSRIGRRAEIEALAAHARIIELDGRTLAPGFHDAHFHFLQTGIKSQRPSLADCRSLEEALERVASHAHDFPPERILTFEDWDETRWTKPRPPRRQDLDRVAPKQAVALRRVDGHIAVANAGALSLFSAACGAREDIDPETGVLVEDALRALDELCPPSEAEVERAIEQAASLCFSRGITSSSDFLRRIGAEAYSRLDSDRLPLHIDAYLLPECLEEPSLLERLRARRRFRVRGLKLFSDGSIGARTAALFEDYADRPGERGMLLLPAETLRREIDRARKLDLSVAVHAIGDRAIRTVLDAFVAFDPAENRARGHRIEHLELPSHQDIDRLVALGVRPCVQPNFVGCWAGRGGLYETALGPARLFRMNPFRTLRRQGTGVFFGSDGMPTGPLFGIRSAISHPVESERLTFEEAHDLYTRAPAEALPREDLAGRLEPGARADLVVLPKAARRQEGEAEALEEVDLTMIEGEIVHERRCP
jgi:hypothetical protein